MELKLKIIRHYGENFIKEGVRIQISYEPDYRDAVRFMLYRSLENADIKRRKMVLRWMVTIMLFASIPAFQLEHPAVISLALAICPLWLAFCDTFMNHILLKQILKEHKEITYERIEIVSARESLLARTEKKQHSYPYEKTTHFLCFKKLLLLTLYDGSSILISRYAFNSSHDYKAFYTYTLDYCSQ